MNKSTNSYINIPFKLMIKTRISIRFIITSIIIRVSSLTYKNMTDSFIYITLNNPIKYYLKIYMPGRYNI